MDFIILEQMCLYQFINWRLNLRSKKGKIRVLNSKEEVLDFKKGFPQRLVESTMATRILRWSEEG
jgi:hypothetical protein